MVSQREAEGIRGFVCDQLRDEPDLSILTLGILKRRYLAQVRCESLSSDARNFMKQVVEEELMKMQDNDKNGSELETKKPQNKRKRDEENHEMISERGDESRAKKLRANHSSSSSESEDKEDCKTGSGESEDEEQDKPQSDAEQELKKSEPNGNHKQPTKSDDSSDEETDKSGKKRDESNGDDSRKRMVEKKAKATKNGETKSSNTSEGKKTPHSDEENESDTNSKSERSDKISGSESSDSEKDDKVLGKNNDPDSDSSSLPSLEDEEDSRTKNKQDEKKKKKSVKKDEGAKGQKDGDKAVVRLKRYIALCGVKKNYKKLLDGCHSIRSKVAVLKKELEDLGVHGQPSIKKCKKVRMKREKAQELAALDVGNIITTQGRPKRRGASAWQRQHDSPSAAYQRTLNSGSDSDQDNNTHRRHRKVTEWANLRGIISDDADSD